MEGIMKAFKFALVGIFGFLTGLGGASFININQIRGGGNGTFILQSVNGVNTWTVPPSQTINFADAEVPIGLINGGNSTYTLNHTPLGTSLEVMKNGIVQQNTVDFTVSGTTVTFLTASIPQPGDNLQVWYRY